MHLVAMYTISDPLQLVTNKVYIRVINLNLPAVARSAAGRREALTAGRYKLL